MMFTDLTIFVTSSHRHDKMSVFEHLPASVLKRVIVVVPEVQFAAYKPYCDEIGVCLQAAPEGMTYIAPKRQWCLSWCPTQYACIMDDDLTFFARNKETKKLEKLTPTGVGIMFADAMDHLRNTDKAMVGISARGGNHLYPAAWEDTFRMHRIWFLDVVPFRQYGINIAPYPDFVMEDFHLILSYLENGYDNRVLYDYAQDDKGSNSPGGCSTFRKAETIERAARWLAAQHPLTVKLKYKETSTGWDGMMVLANGKKQRVDVNVQWKKAFRPRRRNSFAFL